MNKKRERLPKKDGAVQQKLQEILSKRERLPRQKRVLNALQPNFAIDPENLPVYQGNRLSREPNIADERIYRGILKHVRNGHFLTVACDMIGVSYESIVESLEKGRDGQNDLYYQFWIDYKKAEAEAENHFVEHFKDAAGLDWKAAMEFLARRWPQRWMRRDAKLVRHEHSGTIVHKEKNDFADQILNNPVLRKKAREFLTDMENSSDAEIIENE